MHELPQEDVEQQANGSMRLMIEALTYTTTFADL